ncbi:hypothetical protein D9758_007729 [Tetrapyrgos nigripes]|uniref:DUF1772-domain-containing protein n=1 Tax=Tetrapyrgos nigripes TaxID=182062 RepID=A0A8H5G5D7_9AGAR|nr:hypothetical protein D9758_007729 [Tetrapyrgos nigripes]
MSTGPSGIRVAQVLGIAGSAFVSGSIFSISFISFPSLLTSPNHLAAQWANLYARGATLMPPLSILSSSAFAYSAYFLYKNPTGFGLSESTSLTKAKLYIFAALLTVGIVPYTRGMMLPTNNKLKARKDGLDLAYTDETLELAVKWNMMNAGRGLLPFLGAVVGSVGLLL